MDVKQSVGWGDREGCGGGRVGANELSCCCTSGVEVGEVIKEEFQVGSHGFVIQVVEVCRSFMSFFWIAALNAAVRSRIRWLGGGDRSLAVVEDSGEVGGPTLLFMAASRLRT